MSLSRSANVTSMVNRVLNIIQTSSIADLVVSTNVGRKKLWKNVIVYLTSFGVYYDWIATTFDRLFLLPYIVRLLQLMFLFKNAPLKLTLALPNSTVFSSCDTFVTSYYAWIITLIVTKLWCALCGAQFFVREPGSKQAIGSYCRCPAKCNDQWFTTEISSAPLSTSGFSSTRVFGRIKKNKKIEINDRFSILNVNIFCFHNNFHNCMTSNKLIGLRIFFKYNAGDSFKMDIPFGNKELLGELFV